MFLTLQCHLLIQLKQWCPSHICAVVLILAIPCTKSKHPFIHVIYVMPLLYYCICFIFYIQVLRLSNYDQKVTLLTSLGISTCHYKNIPISETWSMLFFKAWLQNHPQFLLHFLIHIDVLMLCRKFELILS